jgi:hypothetical protein
MAGNRKKITTAEPQIGDMVTIRVKVAHGGLEVGTKKKVMLTPAIKSALEVGDWEIAK